MAAPGDQAAYNALDAEIQNGFYKRRPIRSIQQVRDPNALRLLVMLTYDDEKMPAGQVFEFDYDVNAGPATDPHG